MALHMNISPHSLYYAAGGLQGSLGKVFSHELGDMKLSRSLKESATQEAHNSELHLHFSTLSQTSAPQLLSGF